MRGLNFRTRLRTDSFVRKYESIGFIHSTATRRQEVFDSSGTVFLSQLGRNLRSGEEIVDSLLKVFTGVSRDVLRKDVSEFVAYLHQEGYIEVDGDDSLLPSEMRESGVTAEVGYAKDRGAAESSQFLREYFRTHPTVFSFQFYTTENCNEHCVHCYVDKKSVARSLPLEKRLNVIDQLATMGTLDITFTGGEALLSDDLPVLIERARQNDLVIALLSNLTLLTDELFDTITRTDVEVVQTSLYSMDADIHDSITRVKGSHAKTLAALERLKAAGVRVGIGCPVMRQNQHVFHEVLRYGNANGIPVSCDATIMAKENGDTGNLIHRIDRSGFEAAIQSMVDNSSRYRELLANTRDSHDSVSIETCGVGQYMLCMKSTGEFLPCPGFGLVVGNAWDSKIEEVWTHSPQLLELRRLDRRKQFPQCTTCGATYFCNFCIAKFHNETDWQSGIIPPNYCDIAKTNKRVAQRFLNVER